MGARRSRQQRWRERTSTTVSSGGNERVFKLLLKTLAQTRAAIKVLRGSDAAASRARVEGRSGKPQHPAKIRIDARIKRKQRERTSKEHPNKPVTSGFNATSAVCSTVEAPKAPSVPAPAPQKLAVSVETPPPSVPESTPQNSAVSVETPPPSVPESTPQNPAVSVETPPPSVPESTPQNSAVSVETPPPSVPVPQLNPSVVPVPQTPGANTAPNHPPPQRYAYWLVTGCLTLLTACEFLPPLARAAAFALLCWHLLRL